MKVAIIGMAKSTRDLAPYTDPSWTIWGVNGTWTVAPRLDAILDLHAPWIYEWEPYRRPPGHVEHLKAFSGDVYLIERRDDIPRSIAYPIDAVIRSIGRPYLTSSIAMAVALAIHQGAAEIGLWGVDMATAGEYADQRPCLEYLLGLAEGRGIAVSLPEGCPILDGPVYGRGDLNPGGERLTPRQFESRLTVLARHERHLERQAARIDGSIQEAEVTLARGLGVTSEYRQHVDHMRDELAQTIIELEKARGRLGETRYWLAQTPEGAPRSVFTGLADTSGNVRAPEDRGVYLVSAVGGNA